MISWADWTWRMSICQSQWRKITGNISIFGRRRELWIQDTSIWPGISPESLRLQNSYTQWQANCRQRAVRLVIHLDKILIPHLNTVSHKAQVAVLLSGLVFTITTKKIQTGSNLISDLNNNNSQSLTRGCQDKEGMPAPKESAENHPSLPIWLICRCH